MSEIKQPFGRPRQARSHMLSSGIITRGAKKTNPHRSKQAGIPTANGLGYSPRRHGPRSLFALDQEQHAAAAAKVPEVAEDISNKTRSELVSGGYFVPPDIDLLVPSQLTHEVRLPEHRLTLALLLDSVGCILTFTRLDPAYAAGLKPERQRELLRQFIDELEWVFNKTETMPSCSFEEVCDTIGIDAGAAREAIAALCIRSDLMQLLTRIRALPDVTTRMAAAPRCLEQISGPPAREVTHGNDADHTAGLDDDPVPVRRGVQ